MMNGRHSRGFLMGLAGGIVASRLLPPVLAQLRGAAGHSLGEDPFARLIAEHRKLLALLEVMERTPASRPGKRLLLLLTFKRTIAKHAMAEEDVVYPFLYTNANRKEQAEKLYREHGSLKIHIFNLQQSLKDEEKWKQHVAALREEIAAHAAQEETEEFPRVRALREAQQYATLSRNLRQEEALIL